MLPVTVRAVDDLGNHYLTRLDGWETTDDVGMVGTLRLLSPVSDEARELSVIVAGNTEQAIIRIAVPAVGS